MKLSFYGADQCVTGSCHCLEVNGKNILIDCGLQQGRDEVNNEALPFHPGSIDFSSPMPISTIPAGCPCW